MSLCVDANDSLTFMNCCPSHWRKMPRCQFASVARTHQRTVSLMTTPRRTLAPFNSHYRGFTSPRGALYMTAHPQLSCRTALLASVAAMSILIRVASPGLYFVTGVFGTRKTDAESIQLYGPLRFATTSKIDAMGACHTRH